MPIAKVFNVLPGFKMWYSNIMDLLYVMVRRCKFSAYDILYTLAFYEVFTLYKKFEEEVEEENKRAQEDNERMEAQMADMKRSMNKQMNTSNTNSISMPKMPAMPNFK